MEAGTLTRPHTGVHAEAKPRSAVLDWVLTTDHKKIGVMYIWLAFAFFAIGGIFALLMRAQLAGPGLHVLRPDIYNQLMSLHGTFMIIFWTIPVMAGIALTFKMRGEARVGLVYIGDGGTSTGTFHEGLNFAAVQRLPLVVIGEYNHWAYSTPPEKQFAVRDLADKAKGYGIPAVTVDGNDVFAVYEATKFAVDRARRGKGVHFIEVKTYRRKGHAEHDDQSYQPKEELERWARENDPVDRYVARILGTDWVREADLQEIDDRARVEVDQATDVCVDEPLPEADTALPGVYVDPPAADKLWFKAL